eukprot:scaffold845_cov364-Prasinococcus_capsulatus_cf.AAC.4
MPWTSMACSVSMPEPRHPAMDSGRTTPGRQNPSDHSARVLMPVLQPSRCSAQQPRPPSMALRHFLVQAKGEHMQDRAGARLARTCTPAKEACRGRQHSRRRARRTSARGWPLAASATCALASTPPAGHARMAPLASPRPPRARERTRCRPPPTQTTLRTARDAGSRGDAGREGRARDEVLATRPRNECRDEVEHPSARRENGYGTVA